MSETKCCFKNSLITFYTSTYNNVTRVVFVIFSNAYNFFMFLFFNLIIFFPFHGLYYILIFFNTFNNKMATRFITIYKRKNCKFLARKT